MDKDQVARALAELDDNWSVEEGTLLFQQFQLEDFDEAIEFVNQIAEIADDLDHHPNILVHDYKYVSIETTTHSAGNTLTEKDFELAAAIDELFQ